MEREEMIKVLMEKTGIGREEAIAALNECDWDLLNSIIYVERSHKSKGYDYSTIIEENKGKDKKEKGKENGSSFLGIGAIIGRICRFIGKFIKKGNALFFEASKGNEKPVRISVTVLVLLLIFFTFPVAIVLCVGLFCGYKYSISGHNPKYDCVNETFKKASESAENIKNDFKEGYYGMK